MLAILKEANFKKYLSCFFPVSIRNERDRREQSAERGLCAHFEQVSGGNQIRCSQISQVNSIFVNSTLAESSTVHVFNSRNADRWNPALKRELFLASLGVVLQTDEDAK